MVDGIKIKPTQERRKEQDEAHAYGMHLKRMDDHAQVQAAEKERKEAIPTLRDEVWTYQKKRAPIPRGRRRTELYRDAKGKFAVPYTPQQLAEHFGLMTGREMKPPRRKRSE